MKHRLLIRDGTVHRRLASITVSDRDGSIILSIVRKGTNNDGWAWSDSEQQFLPIEYQSPRTKSLRVTVHPSGQVNYHKGNDRHTVFLPSLFDLNEPVPILDFVAPGIAQLDPFIGNADAASIFDVDADRNVRIGFSFAVAPTSTSGPPGEMWHVKMWGAFGLYCSVFDPTAVNSVFGKAPVGAFTTVMPRQVLPARAMDEDEAYVRFHQAAARVALRPKQGVDAAEQDIGPLIFGPRNGVWTIVCATRMARHPTLQVRFRDARYTAETVVIEPWDRLQLVRVQFKVFDNVKSAYEKNQVEFLGGFLDAEL